MEIWRCTCGPIRNTAAFTHSNLTGRAHLCSEVNHCSFHGFPLWMAATVRLDRPVHVPCEKHAKKSKPLIPITTRTHTLIHKHALPHTHTHARAGGARTTRCLSPVAEIVAAEDAIGGDLRTHTQLTTS